MIKKSILQSFRKIDFKSEYKPKKDMQITIMTGNHVFGYNLKPYSIQLKHAPMK